MRACDGEWGVHRIIIEIFTSNSLTRFRFRVHNARGSRFCQASRWLHLVSFQTHSGLGSISFRAHFLFHSMAFQNHIDSVVDKVELHVAIIAIWHEIHVASISDSLGYHFVFISNPFRSHFALTSLLCRLHSDFTCKSLCSVLLWLHFRLILSPMWNRLGFIVMSYRFQCASTLLPILLFTMPTANL